MGHGEVGRRVLTSAKQGLLCHRAVVFEKGGQSGEKVRGREGEERERKEDDKSQAARMTNCMHLGAAAVLTSLAPPSCAASLQLCCCLIASYDDRGGSTLHGYLRVNDWIGCQRHIISTLFGLYFPSPDFGANIFKHNCFIQEKD